MKIESFRHDEWWHSKIPFLIGIAYFCIYINNTTFYQTVPLLLWYILLVVLLASFGYFLNDCFDVKEDALVDKTNFASKFSPKIRILILIGLFIPAYFSWFYITDNHTVHLFLCIHAALLFLYSVPPFRVKNKGNWALLIDSAYSLVIPIVVTFFYFSKSQVDPNYPLITEIAIWAFLLGLRNIIQHHIVDSNKDKISGTYNICNTIGIDKSKFILYYIVLPTELVLFLHVIFFNLDFFALFILSLIFFVLFEIVVNLGKQGFKIVKIFGSGFSSFNSYYEYVMPSLILTVLTFQIDFKFLFLIVFHNTVFFNKLIFSYLKKDLNIFKPSKWKRLYKNLGNNLK